MKAARPTDTKVSLLAVWMYRHVILSAAFWISLFVFGVLSYIVLMQRQGFPAVNVPISTVSGVYLVGDKSVVDKDLTQPLVDVIGQTNGVKSTTATTTDNQVTVVVEYQDDLTSVEGSRNVEDQIIANKTRLPAQAKIAYLAIDAARFNNKYDILLSLSAEDMSVRSLSQQANVVASQLQDKLFEASNVEVVPQVNEGIDPRTGKPVTQQTSFDWYGERSQDELVIKPSIVIGVTAKDGADVIAFDAKARQAAADIIDQPEFAGSRLAVSSSFAPTITQQVNSLQKNLLEGLVIVVLVSLIFISIRAGMLAALGMVMTLAVTAGVLHLIGVTLNTISLFGLVLCLGLIVDDTIIMIEAIDRQRRDKKSRIEAIKQASGKVALASAAGTFTTVLGFAPLLFIGGILGEFVRVLPVTIIVSLLASLLVSLLFIPFMSRWFFKTPSKKSARLPFGWIRSVTSGIGIFIAGQIMNANTRRRKIVYSLVGVAISLIFIAGSGPLFSKLQFDIFPVAKDSDTLTMEFSFVPTVSLDDAKAITEQANNVVVSIGGSDIEKITYLGRADTRMASAQIQLTPFTQRKLTAKQIAESLETELAGVKLARIRINQQGAGPPKEDYPFKVQIDATDPQQADRVARNLVAFLQDKKIRRANDTMAQITEVSYNGEQAVISRLNGVRTVQVQAAFDAADTSALVNAAQQAVENDFLSDSSKLAGLDPSAVEFDFGSETDNQESFQAVLFALPLLVLAMYVLLALQFRSFYQPLLILVAVPFSFFGVAVALLLSDNPLSFFVMIAFFALIGISVNNTILLTDFANQARRRGKSPRQAMAEAVTERVRPLVTTSLTSILALVPLALSDPFWESLAVTLIGGLAASAILVVTAFPAYYLMLEAARSRAMARYMKHFQRKQNNKTNF